MSVYLITTTTKTNPFKERRRHWTERQNIIDEQEEVKGIQTRQWHPPYSNKLGGVGVWGLSRKRSCLPWPGIQLLDVTFHLETKGNWLTAVVTWTQEPERTSFLDQGDLFPE